MTKTSSPVPDELWPQLRREAIEAQAREPELAARIGALIVDRADFSDALGYLLAEELANHALNPQHLRALIAKVYKADPRIVASAQKDLRAIMERDPAAHMLIVPFLFFKGFLALQAYRVAHWLWLQDRKFLASLMQSRVTKCLAIDIHPAAKIGQGIMMDHAHGVVIGETAVIEDNVSLLHNVTLGGTGKTTGDRHPKIRTGVMIGAGAKVLGNIEIGKGARIAAGSVVLENVPAHTTVAGVPARIIGGAGCESPAQEMDQMLDDEGSSI